MDRSQLVRGALDAAVLAVVAEEDGYGYDVVRRLRNAGLTDIGDASVYGTLRRLYNGGALTSYVKPSDEGPHRRYYGITTAGQAQLTKDRETWSDFSRALSALLDPDDRIHNHHHRPAEPTKRAHLHERMLAKCWIEDRSRAPPPIA